jgi:hypothetical protein
MPITILLIALAPEVSAQTLLERIESKIDTLTNRVTETRNNVREVVDGTRSGLSAVTSDMLDSVDEAMEDLQRTLQEERLGRDQFLGPGGDCTAGACAEFRDELLALIAGLETLSNALLVGEAGSGPVDLQRTRDLIQTLPGRALYPLYRVLAGDNELLDSGFIEQFSDVGSDLEVLQDGLGLADFQPLPEDTPFEFSQCDVLLDNAGPFEVASYGITLVSIRFKVMSKILAAAGTTKRSPDAGIHGYVHVTVERSDTEKVAKILDGISAGLSKLGSQARDKLKYCTTLQAAQESRDRQLEILSLLRASRADVNADGVVSVDDLIALNALIFAQ